MPIQVRGRANSLLKSEATSLQIKNEARGADQTCVKLYIKCYPREARKERDETHNI